MNFGDLGADSYSLNVVSPQISYVKAWIPHVMVLGGGTFGMYIDHKDGALINGISVLIFRKDTERRSLSHTLCQARTEPGRGLSWDTKSAGS